MRITIIGVGRLKDDAERRLVDAVIEPALTRRHIAQSLEYLRTKREPRPHKKHGLMPL